jgi:hypothetical protein
MPISWQPVTSVASPSSTLSMPGSTCTHKLQLQMDTRGFLLLFYCITDATMPHFLHSCGQSLVTTIQPAARKIQHWMRKMQRTGRYSSALAWQFQHIALGSNAFGFISMQCVHITQQWLSRLIHMANTKKQQQFRWSVLAGHFVGAGVSMIASVQCWVQSVLQTGSSEVEFTKKMYMLSYYSDFIGESHSTVTQRTIVYARVLFRVLCEMSHLIQSGMSWSEIMRERPSTPGLIAVCVLDFYSAILHWNEENDLRLAYDWEQMQ